MAYRLHITRRQNWSDPDGPQILHEDWLDYLTIDKSFEADKDFELQRETLGAAGDRLLAMALWKDWPDREPGRTEARIWLADGNISASNPDKAMRVKLFLMADAFDAQLQGDKGEVYNSLGEPDASAKKRWWKFW